MSVPDLAFATTAGMLATVNPCAFPLLPGFAAYFVGADRAGDCSEAVPLRALRGLLAGLAVAGGFAATFALAAVVVALGGKSLLAYAHWLAWVVAGGLILLGIAMLAGRTLHLPLPLPAGGRGGRGLRGMLAYGVAYGAASLSCTLPIFLLVVGGALAALPLLPGTTGVASGALEGSTRSLAPAFSLPDLAGTTLDLASLRGRPALLSFLATTCASCAAEMPLLTAAQRTYGSDLRVVLIGVSETPADLAPFVSAHGADSLTALADQPGTTTRAYHVGLIPTSVFLDADGRIAATHVGILDATSLGAQLARAGVADAARAAPALSDKNPPRVGPGRVLPRTGRELRNGHGRGPIARTALPGPSAGPVGGC